MTNELVLCDPECTFFDEAALYNVMLQEPKPDMKIKFLRLNADKGVLANPEPLSAIPEEIARTIDGLFLLKTRLYREDLPRFPRLKVVVRLGVGVDNLDRQALGERGVIVANVPDYGTEEIADHAIAMTLALRRGLPLLQDEMREPNPCPWNYRVFPTIQRLRGSTFGVLGLGRIGAAAALRAKAFGFRVIFYDPYVPNGTDKSLGVERVRRLEELFSRSDVLSVHCPATKKTQGILSSKMLNLLPENAIVVDTARGATVNLDAIYEAMKSGKLAGCALDVLPGEPLAVEPDKAHPLIRDYQTKAEWLHGRFILTPHSAFYSPHGMLEIREKGAQTMRDILIEGLHSNVIHPDAEA